MRRRVGVKDWIDMVSGHLGKVVVILFICMVLSQIALQNDSIRQWLTGVDQWEGRAFE